ncbi:MAG TPA: alpha/beta fold hydrolase [Planctomycetes bacterium]|nr:alpha/beta fold hydrolase [Planctomycetota bacterium]
MSQFVLIHGAWGGAWEFNEVAQDLEKAGHRAVPIDLPGHGEDPAPVSTVTMEAYVARVLDEVRRADGPVILVGHSLAGAVIAQVAEEEPAGIERLVFAAALLPKHGESPLELMESDGGGELLERVVFSEDQSYASLDAETIRDVMLHDVEDPEVLRRATAHMQCPQAVQPFRAEARLTSSRFGSVPKVYVRAARDRVLSPDLQARMTAGWEIERVFTLDSGHFPLLSTPSSLASVLIEIAAMEPAQG